MDLPSTREAMSISARCRGRRGRKSIPTRHGPTVSAHCRSSKRWAESRARLRETTMRAVWYDRQGAADEVLVCGELPTPNAGHGEVRVKLEASGVNPSDTYRRRGPPAQNARSTRVPRPRPTRARGWRRAGAAGTAGRG